MKVKRKKMFFLNEVRNTIGCKGQSDELDRQEDKDMTSMLSFRLSLIVLTIRPSRPFGLSLLTLRFVQVDLSIYLIFIEDKTV